MYKHWYITVKPTLDLINARHIVEVGALFGANTCNLLEWCKCNDAHLTSIDCFPSQELLAIRDRNCGDIFTLLENTSLDALPQLCDYDAILLDGDHNWYTVYHELESIERYCKPFPLVYFHDVAWPYARRDMYYSPSSIPAEFRNEYAKQGMVKGKSDLVKSGGVGGDNFNAIHEGGAHNGVLTGIEDFIKNTSSSFRLAVSNFEHGLGLLAHFELLERYPPLVDFFDYIDSAKSPDNLLSEALLNSTSWKITKPIRYLGRILKRGK